MPDPQSQDDRPRPTQPDGVDPMAPGGSVNDDDSDTDAVEPNEPA